MRLGSLVLGVLLAVVAFALVEQTPDVASRRGEAERVVSMAPNLTEIMVYLGAKDRLAGVTVYCEGIDPAVPRVGSLREPDFERILAAKPDLVLAVASVAQGPLLEGLRRKGLEVEVLSGESIPDLRASVRRLGEIVGAEGRAAAFLERIDQAVAAPNLGADAPHVLFVVDHRPLFVAGGGSFVETMLRAAGGRNAFGDRTEPWLAVELEEIIARDPDVIIDVTLDTPEGRRFWQGAGKYLRAVQRDAIYPFERIRCGIGVPDWIQSLRELLADSES